ncbi:glutenin, high molecular weight subunit PW212-like [Thrips palmi]|uniref:Glutenin, high molecular weight subunit PW212-like n=1 Tax=Thrips palmi TaxID=161013 RepID=A0A6P8Y7Q8_THRPL|nr:glutenin, high molecular weight subunit PW212-like [Thrips palmi]
MRFTLLLAVWCCSVRAQNYPGASQYWSNQQQQPQQQQQQQPQQFQQAYQPQQQPQQLGGQNPFRPQQGLQGHQQLGFGQQNGQQQQQQQQPGFPQGGQQQQQPGFQQAGFQQGPQQQPAFRQQFGNDDRLRPGETTISPFQSRLFSGGAGAPNAAAGLGAPNGTGAPSAPGGPGAPMAAGAAGTPSAPGAPSQHGVQQDNNVSNNNNNLELEPFGAVRQPQPGRPDSQVFQTPTDQALYAVDWSYPRARNAPATLMLKRWGGLSPPEYVAVYRLRGPTPSSSAALHAADLAASPSYSLARDEMRHYPWDAARRHAPPRWHGQGHGAPRDEDFELLPAGMPLTHHHGVDGHYGASQNYMYRTL